MATQSYVETSLRVGDMIDLVQIGQHFREHPRNVLVVLNQQ